MSNEEKDYLHYQCMNIWAIATRRVLEEEGEDKYDLWKVEDEIEEAMK